MNKTSLLHIFMFLMIFQLPDTLYSQRSSRNGYDLPVSGTIRAFLVFAEVINDPNYYSVNYPGWPPGQFPVDPDQFYDVVLNPEEINGIITEIYHQASFGELEIIGDYLSTLVQIDYNTLGPGDEPWKKVLEYLDQSVPSPDITTAHFFTINGTDFDRWEILRSYYYYPKAETDDDYIDVVYIYWRVNSKLNTNNASGYNHSSYPSIIKQKSGINAVIESTNHTGTEWGAARHEIAHSLLGGGNYHTAGHTKTSRTTLPLQGGYSLLNFNGALGTLYNGWDRWWLGWKHPDKTYYISALDATTLAEVNTDLDYVPGAPYHDYILRDFASTGDVIRIKLPYLQSESNEVKNQYLWLENHQMLDDYHDLNLRSAKGLYAYIQVGNDDLSDFSSSPHYLTFLHGLGNYDITYDANNKIYLISDKANPFTGYNILQSPAYNLVDPNEVEDYGVITYHYDKIFYDEVFYPEGVVIDGTELPGSDYSFPTHPSWGTIHDPFTPGQRIGIGTNPSSAPVMTYHVTNGEPYPTPRDYDNRTIYLNGLSIWLFYNTPPGEIKLRVYFDNFDVWEDTRWCGPIVLKERVNVRTGSITLDQGLTPTRPVNPVLFNGEKIYADPTILTAESGSVFSVQATTEVTAKNNSAYISEYNGLLEITDNAVFRVKTGSTLLLKSGSNLLISEGGELEVESGGCLCIENGAGITLQDASSRIHLYSDVTNGVNPVVLTGNYDCRYNIVSTPYSGSGAIVVDVNPLDAYIQNETITNTRTYNKRDVYFGQKVTTTKSFGLAKINSGANVTVNASGDILLDNGFEAALGSQLTLQ